MNDVDTIEKIFLLTVRHLGGVGSLAAWVPVNVYTALMREALTSGNLTIQTTTNQVRVMVEKRTGTRYAVSKISDALRKLEEQGLVELFWSTEGKNKSLTAVRIIGSFSSRAA